MCGLFPRTGVLPSGPCDAITDVGQVRVGHCTLSNGPVQTGVTVILPHAEDVFLRRPLAACCVFNGFGKSVGLMQVQELGCLETPLALTNTFAVGRVATAQICAALDAHPEIGREWPTVNPLVLECNDGYLNDIRALTVTEAHYGVALAQARAGNAPYVSQGSVGAGRGMSCFGLKGGIGTASRTAGGYTVGVLVLSNFGKMAQCIIKGLPVGEELAKRLARIEKQSGTSSVPPECSAPEKGSIIMVLATDAPLDTLQLGRLARRAGIGLARTGSVYGHGSGDMAVAFTTSQSLSWPEPAEPFSLRRLPDGQLDPLFQAATEATEQAIIKALFLAEAVAGRDGHQRTAITRLWPEWKARTGA